MDKKSGELKEEMVIKVLLPFFNNDEALIKKFIQLTIKEIRKMNIVRKYYMCVRSFLCMGYDMLSRHVSTK